MRMLRQKLFAFLVVVCWLAPLLVVALLPACFMHEALGAEQRGSLVIKSMDNTTTLAQLSSGFRLWSFSTPGFVKNDADGIFSGGNSVALSDISSLISVSPPLSYDPTNGTTANISIPLATGSADGYLSSTDWSTFNSKQAAGAYLTAVPDPIVPADGTQGVTGNLDASGYSEAGNIRLDTNTVSTLDTNGNLLIIPNGSGRVDIGNVGDAALSGTGSRTLWVGTTTGTTARIGIVGKSQADLFFKGSDAAVNSKWVQFYSINGTLGLRALNDAYTVKKEWMFISATGLVGFYNITPRYDLDVNGAIRAISGLYTGGTAGTDGTLRIDGNGVATLVSATVGDTGLVPLTLTSTDADAGGAAVDLYRNSASPAANDTLFSLIFSGRDSATNKTSYGYILGSILDPTNGSEDSQLTFTTLAAGTAVDPLRLESNKIMAGTGAEYYAGDGTKVIDATGNWTGVAPTAGYAVAWTGTVSNTADGVMTLLYSNPVGGFLRACGTAKGGVGAVLEFEVLGTAGVSLFTTTSIDTDCQWMLEAEVVGLTVWYRLKMADDAILGDAPLLVSEGWKTFTGTTHYFRIKGTGASANDVTVNMVTIK